MFQLILKTFLLVLLLAGVCVAQEPTDTIRLNTNLVVLDVQVAKRRTGEAVRNLSAPDFVLAEDGVPQEVTHFSQDQLPLSVLLLMDLSGSVSPVLREVRDGALLALERLKANDQVAVMAFSSKVELAQDFTTNRQLIIDRIGRIEHSPVIGHGTSLFEALSAAAQHMQKVGAPGMRRVIIVITDNVAWEYHFVGLSEKVVADQIFDSGSVVCGLVVEGAMSGSEKIFDLRRGTGDAFRRRMTVNPFVDQTGGELLKATRIEVNARLAQMIDHLRLRYSLGFAPRREQADGSFRRVTLTLTPEAQKRLGDVVIKTRQGYYARLK